jgi:phosphatidylinositol glycan class V
VLSDEPALRLSAVLVSNAAFVAAAAVLYALSLRVTRQARAARTAAALFCITPAGVFMSAGYTERCVARAIREQGAHPFPPPPPLNPRPP